MNIFIRKEEPSFFVTWISLQSLQESEKIHLWKLLHTWSTKINVTLDKINSYNGYLPAIQFSAVKVWMSKKKFCTEHTNKIKCKNDNKYNKILYTSKKLITKDIKIRIKENKRKEIYWVGKQNLWNN